MLSKSTHISRAVKHCVICWVSAVTLLCFPYQRLCSDQMRWTWETQQGCAVVGVSLNQHNGVSCHAVYSIPPPVQGWWLAAAVWRRVLFLLKLSQFQLFFPQPAAFFWGGGGSHCSSDSCSQNRRASIKWMRKSLWLQSQDSQFLKISVLKSVFFLTLTCHSSKPQSDDLNFHESLFADGLLGENLLHFMNRQKERKKERLWRIDWELEANLKICSSLPTSLRTVRKLHLV